MSTKKKLITRMAVWAGGVLVLALLVAGAGLLLMNADRRSWENEQKAEKQQIVERSRKYLGEIAKRIEKLPVDATLVGRSSRATSRSRRAARCASGRWGRTASSCSACRGRHSTA
jgi:hypothetical protein